MGNYQLPQQMMRAALSNAYNLREFDLGSQQAKEADFEQHQFSRSQAPAAYHTNKHMEGPGACSHHEAENLHRLIQEYMAGLPPQRPFYCGPGGGAAPFYGDPFYMRPAPHVPAGPTLMRDHTAQAVPAGTSNDKQQTDLCAPHQNALPATQHYQQTCSNGTHNQCGLHQHQHQSTTSHYQAALMAAKTLRRPLNGTTTTDEPTTSHQRQQQETNLRHLLTNAPGRVESNGILPVARTATNSNSEIQHQPEFRKLAAPGPSRWHPTRQPDTVGHSVAASSLNMTRGGEASSMRGGGGPDEGQDENSNQMVQVLDLEGDAHQPMNDHSCTRQSLHQTAVRQQEISINERVGGKRVLASQQERSAASESRVSPHAKRLAAELGASFASSRNQMPQMSPMQGSSSNHVDMMSHQFPERTCNGATSHQQPAAAAQNRCSQPVTTQQALNRAPQLTATARRPQNKFPERACESAACKQLTNDQQFSSVPQTSSNFRMIEPLETSEHDKSSSIGTSHLTVAQHQMQPQATSKSNDKIHHQQVSAYAPRQPVEADLQSGKLASQQINPQAQQPVPRRPMNFAPGRMPQHVATPALCQGQPAGSSTSCAACRERTAKAFRQSFFDYGAYPSPITPTHPLSYPMMRAAISNALGAREFDGLTAAQSQQMKEAVELEYYSRLQAAAAAAAAVAYHNKQMAEGACIHHEAEDLHRLYQEHIANGGTPSHFYGPAGPPYATRQPHVPAGQPPGTRSLPSTIGGDKQSTQNSYGGPFLPMPFPMANPYLAPAHHLCHSQCAPYHNAQQAFQTQQAVPQGASHAQRPPENQATSVVPSMGVKAPVLPDKHPNHEDATTSEYQETNNLRSLLTTTNPNAEANAVAAKTNPAGEIRAHNKFNASTGQTRRVGEASSPPPPDASSFMISSHSLLETSSTRTRSPAHTSEASNNIGQANRDGQARRNPIGVCAHDSDAESSNSQGMLQVLDQETRDGDHSSRAILDRSGSLKENLEVVEVTDEPTPGPNDKRELAKTRRLRENPSDSGPLPPSKRPATEFSNFSPRSPRSPYLNVDSMNSPSRSNNATGTSHSPSSSNTTKSKATTPTKQQGRQTGHYNHRCHSDPTCIELDRCKLSHATLPFSEVGLNPNRRATGSSVEETTRAVSRESHHKSSTTNSNHKSASMRAEKLSDSHNNQIKSVENHNQAGQDKPFSRRESHNSSNSTTSSNGLSSSPSHRHKQQHGASSSSSTPSSRGHQAPPSNGQQPFGPLNCMACKERLEDRHFVQCPSEKAHKFCFSCSKISIEKQQAENRARNLKDDLERIFCPSGKQCNLVYERTPWTFMNSEIETIIRESSRQPVGPNQSAQKSNGLATSEHDSGTKQRQVNGRSKQANQAPESRSDSSSHRARVSSTDSPKKALSS